MCAEAKNVLFANLVMSGQVNDLFPFCLNPPPRS